MSKFYVVQTVDAVDGIEGLPVVQSQVNMRNGTPALAAEVDRSRDAFDLTDYSKYLNGEIIEMIDDEKTVFDAHNAALAQAVIDARSTRGLEQLTRSQLASLDTLIGSTFADSIPFAPGVNIQIAGAIEAYVSNDEISTDNKITALKTGAHLQNLMININAMDSGALYTDYFGN